MTEVLKVFKKAVCANPSCKKEFLVEVELDDNIERKKPLVIDRKYVIVCGTVKPNCKKSYEKSLVEEIEVID